MATPRNPKGTKPPARKRKPAAKVTKRTMITETMPPQPEPRESVMDMGSERPHELSIRRFLWWDVANQHGSPLAIPSPWWERALYAVARIWS